jgi:hypothetical protein
MSVSGLTISVENPHYLAVCCDLIHWQLYLLHLSCKNAIHVIMVSKVLMIDFINLSHQDGYYFHVKILKTFV